MAKLLFNLAGVPDDEAEEVRQLLETQQIDYYETSTGLLGLSFAAIWITDDDKLSEARSLLDDYQLKRKENADAIKAKQIELGLQTSLWHMFRHSPIRVLMVLIFCLVVLYLAVIPFFSYLGRTMSLKSDPAKLLKSHAALIQSDNRKVLSHTQREKDGWYLNSIMIEGCQTPFKFKRKQAYKTIGKGQRVNLTYYPMTEEVAGLQFEVMKVVRIKLS